jgi:hypothetical protein
MTLNNVHLFDLPNEILFLILKKLDNTDVLYSLLGINNLRLNGLVQDKAFSSILNFVSISDRTLDRFRLDILPIFDSISMERILLAGNYPNLRKIKLSNFNQEIFSRYFIGKKLIRRDLFKD